MSVPEILTVGFDKFSFYYFLCAGGYIKILLCVSTIVVTFNYNLRNLEKKSRFFKPLITPEPRIRKFQNSAEMKVNYPTNNKNTPIDFSDNFNNIKNFVQVDHIEKIMKSRLNFSFCRTQKNAGDRKMSPITKIEFI